MNGKRLKGKDNKEETTPPKDLPAGSEASKEEPTPEKLPPNHTHADGTKVAGAAHVDGDEKNTSTDTEIKPITKNVGSFKAKEKENESGEATSKEASNKAK